MIDWDRVRDLNEDVGEDAFEEVILLFFSELAAVLDALSEAGATGSIPEKLHFLKGGAANLGFSDFVALCLEYEKQLPNPLDMAPLLTCFAKSRAAFLQDPEGVLPDGVAGQISL